MVTSNGVLKVVTCLVWVGFAFAELQNWLKNLYNAFSSKHAVFLTLGIHRLVTDPELALYLLVFAKLKVAHNALDLPVLKLLSPLA